MLPIYPPVTLVVNDKGKKVAEAEVADRVNRGEQVLAIDLLFSGNAWKESVPMNSSRCLHGMGDRSIGMEAAQMIEIARWMEDRYGDSQSAG